MGLNHILIIHGYNDKFNIVQTRLKNSGQLKLKYIDKEGGIVFEAYMKDDTDFNSFRTICFLKDPV